MDNSIEAELSNISTRSFVQTGDDVMIGGLIIEGNAPATVLIRARGPSMSGAPFFVPGTLADPFLQLFSGQNVIAQNNNWQDAPSWNRHSSRFPFATLRTAKFASLSNTEAL